MQDHLDQDLSAWDGEGRITIGRKIPTINVLFLKREKQNKWTELSQLIYVDIFYYD